MDLKVVAQRVPITIREGFSKGYHKASQKGVGLCGSEGGGGFTVRVIIRDPLRVPIEGSRRWLGLYTKIRRWAGGGD